MMVGPATSNSSHRSDPAAAPQRDIRRTTEFACGRAELGRWQGAGEIADLLGVTRQTAYNWARRFQSTTAWTCGHDCSTRQGRADP